MTPEARLTLSLREVEQQARFYGCSLITDPALADLKRQAVELRELRETLRKIEVFADHHRNDAYAVQQILRVVRGRLAASSEEPG